MQHPADGMGPLTPQREAAIGLPIKLRAPVNELSHIRRTFVRQHPYGPFPAQSVPGKDGIGRVHLGRVSGADCGRDAALRVRRTAVVRPALRQDEDATCVDELDRGAQSSNAASDDEELTLEGIQTRRGWRLASRGFPVSYQPVRVFGSRSIDYPCGSANSDSSSAH